MIIPIVIDTINRRLGFIQRSVVTSEVGIRKNEFENRFLFFRYRENHLIGQSADQPQKATRVVWDY